MSKKTDSDVTFFEKLKSSLFEKQVYQPPADSAERYDPDPDIGLTSYQVKMRKEGGYVNNAVNSSNTGLGKIILSNLFLR